GNDGIFVQTPNDRIDSNFIHDIGRTCCLTNHDHGIYIDASLGASAPTVQNNVIYNIPFGWAIHLYPGTLSNALIINNTIDPHSQGGNTGCMINSVALSSSRIENNLCINPVGGVIVSTGTCCGGSASNVSLDHNVTTASGIVDTTSGYSISNNITGASISGLVNNEAGADFHLFTGSPAIGAGTSVGAPSLDIEGTSRSQLS